MEIIKKGKVTSVKNKNLANVLLKIEPRGLVAAAGPPAEPPERLPLGLERPLTVDAPGGAVAAAATLDRPVVMGPEDALG